MRVLDADEIRAMIREEIQIAMGDISKALFDRYSITRAPIDDALWEVSRAVECATAAYGTQK